jgi:hypothetical protein
MVAIGILGTLFTIAAITLAVIGIKKWVKLSCEEIHKTFMIIDKSN